MNRTVSSFLRGGILALCILISACGKQRSLPEEAEILSNNPSLSEPCSIVASDNLEAMTSEMSVGAGVLNPEAKAKRFIVKARVDSTFAASASIVENHLTESVSSVAQVEKVRPSYYTMEFENELTTDEVARHLSSVDYEYVEPDVVQYSLMTPSDPKLSTQWAHNVVRSAQAWDLSRGDSSVIVAVIDSGIDYSHQDLVANMWVNPQEANNGRDNDGNGLVGDIYGWNFVSNNNRPKADDASTYHGTHVAGTIGAVGNNGIGISGHAQRVKLMALKFLNSSGSGFTSNAVKAIDYAISKKAKVISNSWGSSSYSQALSDAITRAKKAGILFVAAAGNAGANNDNKSFYPANYPQDNVISVAATDKSDRMASFSNYGAKKVHLAAPGVNIFSTMNGNTYQYLSGTSMATPLVSGVLATMISLRKDLSYQQIKSALMSGVDKISAAQGKVASNGRVNAFKSLSLIKQTTASPPPSPSSPVTPPSSAPGNCS